MIIRLSILIISVCTSAVKSQFQSYNSYENKPYSGNHAYNFPVPDSNYGQYTYNKNYDTRNLGSREPYKYDQPVKLPGVLGGWRPDLQGKKRLESDHRQRDVIVMTPYGQIQGFNVYLFDNPFPDFRYEASYIDKIQGTVSVFLGIPYALPPINEGRFKPPRPRPSWQSLHAVDYKPACPQPEKYVNIVDGVPFMDEDCLYLNIFSPSTKSGLVKLYPVMVYIHGGEFSRGTGNDFPGHILATFYEVVVVTFNYRLGALGFLSTGDYNSPGNYGILDQCMVLRWIYENIASFNGDKNSITLFGPDAGAASAGLLMVNPRTSQFVSKVIAQSGSALADWALIQDPWRAQNTSRVFAQHLGCSTESSWKLVDCLKRGRSAYELGTADFKPAIGLIPWGPVLDINITMPADWYDGWNQPDWNFCNDTVETLITSRSFNKNLIYMSGVTTQEAAYILYNNKTLEPYFEIDEKFLDDKIKELVLQYNYTLNSKGVSEALKYMYTYWPDPQCKQCIRNQFVNMLTDFLYVSPHDKIAKLLLKQNVPVYLYVQNTTVEAFKLPEWRKASHDIEYNFLIGAPFLDTEMLPMKQKISKDLWTRNDRNMSHFFMQAFSNFAKYGDPTYTQILGIHFEQAVIGQLNYLNINTTYNSSILSNYRQTECGFWSYYIPTVVGRILPTYPPYSDLWWQQSSPIHFAFWSVSFLCMLLLVIAVVLCILWLNGKREINHFYNEDFLTVEKESELRAIESRTHSNGNIYEYRDSPSVVKTKTGSTASLRTDISTISMKDHPHYIINNNSGGVSPKSGRRRDIKLRTIETSDGVPQTAV